MISKIALPILIFCNFASITVTQELPKSIMLSGGLLNGRFWKGLPDEAKNCYVSGFNEALMIASVRIEMDTSNSADVSFNKNIEELFKYNMSYGERAHEVDKFYMEGANTSLPIVVALRYIALKARGASAQELDGFITNHRKLYAIPLD